MKPLLIDLAKKDTFPRGVFNFSGMTGGTAIRIFSSDVSKTSYSNVLESLRECHIIGPGRDTNTVGIEITHVPGLRLVDCDIEGFGTGVLYGSQTWCNALHHVNIHGCGVCVRFPHGTINAGELMRAYDCTFYNSHVAIMLEEGHQFSFVFCSFDYNKRHFEVRNSGQINLFACHVEHRPAMMYDGSNWDSGDGNSLIRLQGEHSAFRMYGGEFHVAGKYSGQTAPMIYCEGQVAINGSKLFNFGSKYLVHGGASVVLRDYDYRGPTCYKKAAPWILPDVWPFVTKL